MERKLASVQVIKELNPIKDADRIECATILGWQVIVLLLFLLLLLRC